MNWKLAARADEIVTAVATLADTVRDALAQRAAPAPDRLLARNP